MLLLYDLFPPNHQFLHSLIYSSFNLSIYLSTTNLGVPSEFATEVKSIIPSSVWQTHETVPLGRRVQGTWPITHTQQYNHTNRDSKKLWETIPLSAASIFSSHSLLLENSRPFQEWYEFSYRLCTLYQIKFWRWIYW